MKIAVYAICKNESKHVDQFVDSVSEADEIVVLDTGSTDDTVKLLEERGITAHQVTIDPWRFDDARNRCLDLVSSDVDVCVRLDFDERLSKGWKGELESKWISGITRANYWFEEIDGRVFREHNIHSRHGYRWYGAFHEQLVAHAPENACYTEIRVTHKQDSTKVRDYLAMVELAASEAPNDARILSFLAAEHYYRGDYDATLRVIESALRAPNLWSVQASRLCNIASRIFHGGRESELWALRSISYAPKNRDAWYHLAQFYHGIGAYMQALAAVEEAIRCQEGRFSNISDPDAWNGGPYLIAADSAQKLGQYDKADKYYSEGCRIHPDKDELAKLYGEFLSIKKAT